MLTKSLSNLHTEQSFVMLRACYAHFKATALKLALTGSKINVEIIMKHFIKPLLVLTFIWNSQAFAMGLGQETLHSSLGEKIFIELPIKSKSLLNKDQLRFSIASLDTYKKMGIELSPDHKLLQFSVLEDNNGELTLLITSTKPINEPFFNFIIYMSSPSGQVNKEVSVLLDTPK